MRNFELFIVLIFKKKPESILICRNESDVIAAVKFSKKSGLPVAVDALDIMEVVSVSAMMELLLICQVSNTLELIRLMIPFELVQEIFGRGR